MRLSRYIAPWGVRVEPDVDIKLMSGSASPRAHGCTMGVSPSSRRRRSIAAIASTLGSGGAAIAGTLGDGGPAIAGPLGEGGAASPNTTTLRKVGQSGNTASTDAR